MAKTKDEKEAAKKAAEEAATETTSTPEQLAQEAEQKREEEAAAKQREEEAAEQARAEQLRLEEAEQARAFGARIEEALQKARELWAQEEAARAEVSAGLAMKGVAQKRTKPEKREERRARLHALLVRARTALADRLHRVLRPLDADDKDALEALLEGLIAGRKDGYSEEEEEALEALWQDWREARRNTPWVRKGGQDG